MFDTLVPVSPAGRRVRTLVVSGSIVAHAVAVAALVVLAFWRIDKLPLADRPVRAAFVMPGAPAPSGGPKQTMPKARPPERPTKRVITEVTQPTDRPPENAPTSADATTGTDTPGGEGGPGLATDPTAATTTDGTCTNPPCGGEEPSRVIEKKKKTVTIAPNVAAGLRTAGNDQIHAPDSTRVTMLHEGKDRVVGTVKLCIGTDGAIDSAGVLRSTGYPDYDAKLIAEMRAWRYSPYRVNGEAVPFCTAVTVVYRMTR